MWIRRRTLERLLTDRDRAHAAERRALIAAITEQSDRILILAGKPPLHEPAPAETHEPVEDDFYPVLDLGQEPDDLGNAW